MLQLNNSVRLLEKYDISFLEEMKNIYAHDSAALSGLHKFGSTKKTGPKASPDYVIEAKVISKTLDRIEQRMEPNVLQLKNRLKRARFYKNISNYIAALTSAGVLTAIASKQQNTIIIITALLNFASALFLSISGNLGTDTIGGKNLLELFDKLTTISIQSQKLRYQMSRLESSGDNAQILRLIGEADTCAFELIELEKRIAV
jgi:hypothetical protein